MCHYFKSIQSRTFFFILWVKWGFFSTCKKKFTTQGFELRLQGFLKLSSKRGHILWNVTTKKNLLLLHTCRVYRISHLLIRLRKGMFRYFFKKEFSPSGYIRSDAKFFLKNLIRPTSARQDTKKNRQFTLSHNLGYKRWINSKTRIIIFVFIQSPLLAFFCRHRQHFDSTLYFVRVHSKVGYYIVITYLGNK